MATPNRGSESNPKNNSSQLFRKLTRFFSGNIVNYKRQFYRKEKRRDLNKYKFTSASGKAFKRSAHNPFQTLQANIMSNQNRVERYGDFEEMEYEPIIASSLDLYADEMTTSNALEPLLRIECPNDEIKVILNDLFYNILNIEHNLYGWSRTMCKFGDFFLYLDIDPEFGIQNVIGLPSTEVERLEGQDKTNPNYIQFQWNSGGMTFENWHCFMVHPVVALKDTFKVLLLC